MTLVKICGINDPVAFDTAVEAGADWVGFVFFPPSPRYVTPDTAAALSRRIAGGPPRVGLFVNPDAADIVRVLDTVKLDILQIYGAANDLPAIRARFGLPLWRAVGISSTADLPSNPAGADRLLLEAKPPPNADRPGGNATTFDWSLLRGWSAPAPWLLAGGLTPDNVATAIRETGATAVDISSGVESRKGVKDAALIRAFIAAAKATAAQATDPTATDPKAIHPKAIHPKTVHPRAPE
jgi:phosphoribosylanthranilate isomerase